MKIMTYMNRISMKCIEVFGVSAQLLHCTCTESVSCCNQHSMAVLVQPEGYLKANSKFINRCNMDWEMFALSNEHFCFKK